MRSDEYDTAEMLKRLQRQVSDLRDGDTGESVTIVQTITDTIAVGDAIGFSEYGYALGLDDEANVVPDPGITDALNDGQYTLLFQMKPRDKRDGSSWPDYLRFTGTGKCAIADGNADTADHARLRVDDTSVSSGAEHTVVGTIPHEEDEAYVGGFSVDGTATGGSVETFKNGDLVETIDFPGTDNQETYTDGEFQLNPDTGLSFVVDRIDFYNRALSQHEVKQWSVGLQPATGLLMSINFEEGPGETPRDANTSNPVNATAGSPGYAAPIEWEYDPGFVWQSDPWSIDEW